MMNNPQFKDNFDFQTMKDVANEYDGPQIQEVDEDDLDWILNAFNKDVNILLINCINLS